MAERGLRPVLAARSRDKLGALAERLGGSERLETAVANVDDPPSVRALVEEGDVLVTTVGPFVRWGAPAAAAATRARAHYIDSTGEPPFIREVFERYGVVAERAGCAMLTALGYDWVPGNLAGGLALERAGESAVRVDIGYFVTGAADPGLMSGGTRASLVGVLAAPSFSFRDGRVRPERGAKHLRSFKIGAQGAGGRVGRQLGALRAPSRCGAAARGQLLSRLVRPGVARHAAHVRRHERGDEAARCRRAVEGRGREAGEGLLRRTGRGGPLEDPLAHRRDRVRRHWPCPERGPPHRRRRLHLHRAHARLGRRACRGRCGCAAAARSARSTASASRR